MMAQDKLTKKDEEVQGVQEAGALEEVEGEDEVGLEVVEGEILELAPVKWVHNKSKVQLKSAWSECYLCLHLIKTNSYDTVSLLYENIWNLYATVLNFIP